jgi:hypothetical protein
MSNTGVELIDNAKLLQLLARSGIRGRIDSDLVRASG